MTYRKILGLSLASGTFVVWACGGSTGTPNGAGSDGGSSSGASASGSGSSSGTSAGSGSGSTGDDGGGSGSGSGGGSSGSSSGASSSGSTTDGGQTVPGNQFNCGTTVANAMPCTPPDVCCEARGMGGAETATCEAESACTAGVATGCDVGSCPSGAVCCATITIRNRRRERLDVVRRRQLQRRRPAALLDDEPLPGRRALRRCGCGGRQRGVPRHSGRRRVQLRRGSPDFRRRRH